MTESGLSRVSSLHLNSLSVNLSLQYLSRNTWDSEKVEVKKNRKYFKEVKLKYFQTEGRLAWPEVAGQRDLSSPPRQFGRERVPAQINNNSVRSSGKTKMKRNLMTTILHFL